jgi:predicted metal-dependent HD superfamily phosphohydrolase
MQLITTIAQLKKIWFNLVINYSLDLNLSQKLWIEIETIYQQHIRYYHNLDHLIHFVDLALQYQHQIEDFDTFLFSVFYHDFIYQVPGKNNELQSAEVAQKRLLLIHYPDTKIRRCFLQICATENHRASQEEDTNWLIDLDLAILGANRDKYIEYANNIRQEYSIYPDKIYNQGRSKLLNTFLNEKSLYKTKLFQDEFEEVARKNLEWELEQLIFNHSSA